MNKNMNKKRICLQEQGFRKRIYVKWPSMNNGKRCWVIYPANRFGPRQLPVRRFSKKKRRVARLFFWGQGAELHVFWCGNDVSHLTANIIW